MDDQELAAIRAARLQQLQQQNGPSNGGGDAEGEDPEAAAAQRRSEEEMKRAILTQILEPAARERRTSPSYRMKLMLLIDIRSSLSTYLRNTIVNGRRFVVSRISLVSPARAQQIENNLVRMARSGMQRISDEQFLNLLKQADEAQSGSKPSKIVVRLYIWIISCAVSSLNAAVSTAEGHRQ